jgi:hypothetical protein
MGKPLQPQYVTPQPVGIVPVLGPTATMTSLPVPPASLVRAAQPSTPQQEPSTPALADVVSQAMSSTTDGSFNLSSFLDQREHSEHSAHSDSPIDVLTQ